MSYSIFWKKVRFEDCIFEEGIDLSLKTCLLLSLRLVFPRSIQEPHLPASIGFTMNSVYLGPNAFACAI